MKASLMIVGDSGRSDFTFGGVVESDQYTVDDLERLFKEWEAWEEQQENLDDGEELDFADWLVAMKGFTEDPTIGYAILFRGDLEP